jgi:competence protein ComEA
LLTRFLDLARASPGEVGVVAVAGLAIVAGSVMTVVRARASGPPPAMHRVVAATPSAGPSAALLVVHVAGMVASPGVYELAAGSRVKDAVAAAGGAVAGADQDAINLAEPLQDGEKVYVPKVGEAPGAGAATPGGKVNLNLATEQQLEGLPGVGPVLAQRIIDYRLKKRFTSVKQLLDVEGFGQKKYDSVKDLVMV